MPMSNTLVCSWCWRGLLAPFHPSTRWMLLRRKESSFTGVFPEGECGAPRGRGGGIHGVQGASGGVPARRPCISPDLCPRARPSPLRGLFSPEHSIVFVCSPVEGGGGLRFVYFRA